MRIEVVSVRACVRVFIAIGYSPHSGVDSGGRIVPAGRLPRSPCARATRCAHAALAACRESKSTAAAG